MESTNDHQEKMIGLRCLLLVMLLGCRQTAVEIAKPPEVDCSRFQPGDLVLRCGNSFYSNFFRDCSQTEKLYSHAGILVRAAGSDSIRVLHIEMAEHEDESDVRLDPVGDFINDASAWAVYRLNTDDNTQKAIAKRALNFLRSSPAFDLDFDASDTTALYCTEMVMHCINEALGQSLIQPSTTINGKKFVAADDTYLHDCIELVQKSNNSKQLLTNTTKLTKNGEP